MNEITLTAPSDYHVHLRQGKMQELAALYSFERCGRVMAMPNTVAGDGLTGPLNDFKSIDHYLGRLDYNRSGCEVKVAFKLLPDHTSEKILNLSRHAHVIAAKLYPSGVTTNSHDGIPREWLDHPSWDLNDHGMFLKGNNKNFWFPPKDPGPECPHSFIQCLKALNDLELVLSLHGETPGYVSYSRKTKNTKISRFLFWVGWVLGQFPKMKIVLEHISTVQEVEFVRAAYRAGYQVGATITPHHLMLTVDDVVGHPHNYCRPPAQFVEDRNTLLNVFYRGEYPFFLGTDSAPHEIGKKECARCCAGVFNASVFLEWLLEKYIAYKKMDIFGLDQIQDFISFTSGNGDTFYGFSTTGKKVTLVETPWLVPMMIVHEGISVRPWLAGEILNWKLKQ